ncbi:MAG: tetratricopeptide repeat protein [Bacteroidetes bacterium]|nr:tetratricopeptide repeat protein [Bacteroidota bacterium]
MHNNDSIWEYMQNNKNKANLFALKSILYAEKLANPWVLANTYHSVASLYYFTSEYEKAILYNKKALGINIKLNDTKGLIKAYNNLGIVNQQLGNYSDEIKFYEKALKLAQAIKDTLIQSSVINNIGETMMRQENYELALTWNLKNLKLRELIRDEDGITSTQINIANAYFKLKNIVNAEKYYRLVKPKIEKTKNNYYKSIFYLDYGVFLKDLNKFNEAIEAISLSISASNAIGDKDGILVNMLNLADIYSMQKKFSEAIKTYHQTLTISKNIKNPLWEKQSYSGLNTSYYSMGEYKKAYDAFYKYDSIKEYIKNSELREKVSELEKKYKTQELTDKNALLQNEIFIKKIESKQQKTIVISLLILLLILLTAAFLFYKLNRSKQLIELRSATIKAEESERMRIAKDIHDDLGSGLTKLRFMSEALKTEEQNVQKIILNINESSNQLVDSLKDLIWVMNKENSTLENLISRIREFSNQYLEDCSLELKFIAPAQIPENKINIEVSRNIFMIVKESLQNIVKHAKAKNVIIEVLLSDVALEILISDDGCGIKNENKTGNGLLNMSSRAKQINAIFNINSSSSGTKIKLNIALTKYY